MTTTILEARSAILETKRKLHNELRLMPSDHPEIPDRLRSLQAVNKRLATIDLLDEKSSARQQSSAVRNAMYTCRSCAPLPTKEVEYDGFEEIVRNVLDIGVAVVQLPIVFVAFVLMSATYCQKGWEGNKELSVGREAQGV